MSARIIVASVASAVAIAASATCPCRLQKRRKQQKRRPPPRRLHPRTLPGRRPQWKPPRSRPRQPNPVNPSTLRPPRPARSHRTYPNRSKARASPASDGMNRGLLILSIAALSLMPAHAASRILVHGHRGARAIYPENTIPAFRYAIDSGVDFLEMDVAVTKDNVLVISHDPHINGEICSGPHPGIAIHELTLAELREYDCGALKNSHFPKQHPVPGTRIPTLDEVLNLADGNSVQFNIETKSFPDHPEL